jgi:hypothetical protein
MSEKKLATFLAMVITTAVLITAGFVFSQDATSAGNEDLLVPPPGYAKFDSAMTKSMLNIFNSPIMKAQRGLSADEMGGYVFDTLKVSCYTTDRGIEELIGYFAEKLGQEAELETGALVDSPDEMIELEEMTGLSWDKGFIEKYKRAYEEYESEESQTASFNAGNFPEKLVAIEIENPYFDPSTFKKVNKTSIMYMVFSYKKK